MNGHEHYREAERLVALATEEYDVADAIHWSALAAAQAHAALALAAATALSGVIGNNVSSGSAINDLAHDSETLTAVNDWHEAAARRTSP
ncbi:hypothetical protein PP488_gp54 [Gordonia phage Agueybana]|uniref:Uncharacterized protein n=1 Tax=Gordonia phage Agueybana TaxID=2859634 RepID=A0AC61NGB8_9CAUD|nr:hypothetical protein PP488_gp54 [Gordonia phage Agueybana]QYC54612.1 hypothetical protein SEA_AGUEYBANA_54 [Gordonia phage Agueybana]